MANPRYQWLINAIDEVVAIHLKNGRTVEEAFADFIVDGISAIPVCVLAGLSKEDAIESYKEGVVTALERYRTSILESIAKHGGENDEIS